MSKCETPYTPNAKSMETHKYVCITHNMSTHKIGCPAKILIIDESNYRELAQIYVDM